MRTAYVKLSVLYKTLGLHNLKIKKALKTKNYYERLYKITFDIYLNDISFV